MARLTKYRFIAVLIFSLTYLGLTNGVLLAQEPPPGGLVAANVGSETEPSAQAIPVEDIPEAAIQAAGVLETTTLTNEASVASWDLRSKIDRLLRDIDIELASIEVAFLSTPKAQSMSDWRADIRSLLLSLRAVDRDLDGNLERVREALGLVDANIAQWTATNNAVANMDISSAVQQRIDTTLSAFAEAREGLTRRRDELLGLRNRMVEPLVELDRTFKQLDARVESRLSRIFSRERPALWTGDLFHSISNELSEGGLETIERRLLRFYDYLRTNIPVLALQIIVFIGLAIGLRFLRSSATDLAQENYDLQRATVVFARPTAMAMVIALALTVFLHPNAPYSFYMLVLALAVPAAALIVNSLLSSTNQPVVWALVLTFMVDLMRRYLDTLPMLERTLFLVELSGAIIFLLWLRQPKRIAKVPAATQQEILFRVTNKLTGIAIVLLGSALVADVVGLGDLADLIGGGTLLSAYSALTIYAALNVLRSLLAFALILWPLKLLRLVSSHRSQVRERTNRYLGWAALALWALSTLDIFGLRSSVVSSATYLVNAEATLGAFTISLGDVLVVVATIWASFFLARTINLILSEEVYERVTLPRGVPYAISTLTRYTIIFLGGLFALAAIGLELTQVAIIAGGLSVGIGFGLQTIISNFVSGLILLFERPLKVGDDIQLGGISGEIRRIGIRASSLKTDDGAEVILPNSKLISDAVTNWTFKDRRRRIEVNVKLDASIDAQQVLEALQAVASEHPNVLSYPAPRASLVKFDVNGLEFLLRAWIAEFRDQVMARSELNGAIQRKLADAGIIGPLRDLSVPERPDTTGEDQVVQPFKPPSG